jgi:ApbE superfamily uncharacterized protein (UPF0280 family)
MSDQEGVYRKRADVERSYRSAAAHDLLQYRVAVGESDLWIQSEHDFKQEIEHLLKSYRRQIKGYLDAHPGFLEALTPWPEDQQAPEIVQLMIRAAKSTGVGPMAAVAGAIAAMIGKAFEPQIHPELIIENGGDIYLRSLKERVIAVFAGSNSPFSGKLGVLIQPQPEGIGVCTSSGIIGPSLSFGKADAVMVTASDPALADAAATAGANSVRNCSDLPKAIALLKSISGIRGALIIKEQKIAAWGEIELVPLDYSR